MSTNGEQTQRNIEEFMLLQQYMMRVDKGSEAYEYMKVRYKTLKAVLQSSGVNLDELDIIKE